MKRKNMKRKILSAAALAAVTLLAACAGPEEKPGSNSGQTPTNAPVSPTAAAPTSAPAADTAAPAVSPTSAPAAGTTAPASKPTPAPAVVTSKPTSGTTAPATKPTTVPASQPAQTGGSFAAIAGSWYSPANNAGGYGHGDLSLEISEDGTCSLGALVYDGDGKYHVADTTMTLSLQKWADGSERLYFYDTYTYEDVTYSRKN